MIRFCFGADRGAHWKTAGSFVVAERHRAGKNSSAWGRSRSAPSQPGSSSSDHSWGRLQGETNLSVARRLGSRTRPCATGARNGSIRALSACTARRGPGEPRAAKERAAELLHAPSSTASPADATHWTVRSAAATTGLSKSTVARTFALFGVQPHRSKHFKLSTDPEFVDKVRDIVGLYLDPPDHALVLCVDEKTQIQAYCA